MKIAALFAGLVAGAALTAHAVGFALLSVSTDEATLDFARSAVLRPAAKTRPLPYSEAFILQLSGAAQRHALEENEQVADENAYAEELVARQDAETQAAREGRARQVLGQSDLGKAVLKTADYFAEAAAGMSDVSLLNADADGFIVAPADARYVRLFFGVPQFDPLPAPLPNISNEPIHVTLPVMLKVESPSGEKLLLETFEQTATAANSNALLGPARIEFFERLLHSAVESSLRRAQ